MIWTRSRYKRERGLLEAPSIENVERIIARCSWRYATVFSLLRDTGAMPEELHRVKRRDINLDDVVINLPRCKYHKPRARKLKALRYY